MWVMDSYDHYKKCLGFDHEIARVKRIWINRKTKSALVRHRNILQVILDRLMSKKTLLDVCKENLGKDATPADSIPDAVACASTVTTILQQVYPKTPHIAGTATLYEWLKKPENEWVAVSNAEPECIIISPTSYGNGKISGHTGFVMENGLIASNDSRTGKFLQNYTESVWRDRYQTLGGFPVYFFKHK
jgi:hypothetical protein